MELTELERQVLAFAERRYSSAGRREADIRAEFDCSVTRYQQMLNALLDKPQALAADPVLVRRLMRLRAARRDVRTAS